MTSISVTREQILAFRRRVTALDARRPHDATSLRTAAWAGLQDSMPRAAVLSVNARVDGCPADVLDDPTLVQTWGPRYSVYAVAAEDLAVFTLGRWPDAPAARERATDLAQRLRTLLVDESTRFGAAGRALGVHPNALRYAAVTGSIVLRWDGARQPTIRVIDPPDTDPVAARCELARRFLRVFGPSTPAAFASWAGVRPTSASATFALLDDELAAVTTPIGEAVMLERDTDAVRAAPPQQAAVRLLPSGDTYYLLQGDDRTLLVEEVAQRARLWTSRVWPGALLADGEIVGTWRRAADKLTVDAWVDLDDDTRERVQAEAAALPLAGLPGPVKVSWTGS